MSASGHSPALPSGPLGCVNSMVATRDSSSGTVAFSPCRSGNAEAVSPRTPSAERTTIWAPAHSPPAAVSRMRAEAPAAGPVAEGRTFSDSSATQTCTAARAGSAQSRAKASRRAMALQLGSPQPSRQAAC